MKIVLLADVRGTGKKGELVEASDGYARNYLFPRKLAKEANTQVMNELKGAEESRQYHVRQETDEARKIAKAIDGKTLKLTAKSGQGGKLFGSITAKEISEELKRTYHFDIDKRKIILNGDIKAYGTYECGLKLYNGVSAKIFVMVGERT